MIMLNLKEMEYQINEEILMSNITTKLSNLTEKQIISVMKEYLFGVKKKKGDPEYFNSSGLYIKKNPLTREFYDLEINLVSPSDKMYESKSNAVPADVAESHNRNRYSSIVRTFKLREQFLERLENKGFDVISIKRYTIKSAIESLPKEEEAVLKYFIFYNIPLKKSCNNWKDYTECQKFQLKIDRMTSSKRRYLRDKAMTTLIRIIILNQEKCF